MNDLMLNTNIYKKNWIFLAAKAFEDICNINIIETNDYIVCKFSNCIYDTIETIREFENYIIDLMNTNLDL